ncbi:hypothetical protein Tco_1572996, partial [Tanacetum coccineum]
MFQELLLDAEKPLYEGCPDFTKLSVIVKLLNLKGKYGCSDKFFTELLGLCLLYWKDDKDLTASQTCGISRWKVDNKTHKVYENILAKYATRRITDGVLHHPADSQAWRTIDEKFPEIAEDPRNLRLGISADGVDVNTGNRHHCVCCPYSGFKGCVVCGKDTNCVRLSSSSKQSYVGHKRYLPYNHPFRKQRKAFNGQQEFLLAPNPMTGEQIYNE